MLTKLKASRVRLSRKVEYQARNLVGAKIVAQVDERVLPSIRDQIWGQVSVQVFLQVRAGVRIDAY